MLPCSGGSADAGAEKNSGTCSSVSLVLRSAAHQTARPATSIATLRCETATAKASADDLAVSIWGRTNPATKTTTDIIEMLVAFLWLDWFSMF